MALRDEEILRLKRELGYNVTLVGADVYISYIAVFDRAVQPYLIDPATSSSTTVVAAPTGAAVTLTFASNPTSKTTQANAFVVGTRVVVDVGPNQETSVIQALSGLNVTMTLTLAHGTGGTQYPILQQGSEQFIRDYFTRIDNLEAELTQTAPLTAGLAALTGEVELFNSGHGGRRGGKSKFEDLIFQRLTARRDLALLVGVPYLPDMRGSSGGGGLVELY